MSVIHETIIRDIVDIITDVKNTDEVQMLKNRGKSFKSITSKASDLVLVFPVIVSKNLNIENAAMIAKAIERKAVSLLQMLFSAIQITDADDVFDYLSRFHTNIKKGTVDDFINAMDELVNESSIIVKDKEVYDAVMEGLKYINNPIPEDINESSLNDYKFIPRAVMGGENVVIKEFNADDYNDAIDKTRKQTTKDLTDGFGKILDSKTDKLIKAAGANRAMSGKDQSAIVKDRFDMIKDQILDSDVKKANELIPTSIVINFVNVKDGNPISQQAVIGVKAKIYTADSTDIINRIIIKNKDNNYLQQIIRASTREISFFKDFMFAIDKAKIDALSQSRKGSSSKMWKILERRAIKSKFRQALASKNDSTAISTLVISQEDVETLKKTENINVEAPAVIRPIMEAYNLMGFCIVDESTEVAKFIFDTGDDMYETLSFTLLERESRDNSTKKLINLMSKMTR